LYLFKRHLSDTCFQYGRLQTGSSYNFVYNPDINAISTAKIGFPGTPDSTQLRQTLYFFKRHLSDTCFQYGRLQTGSSYNFAYNAARNAISTAKLGFPGTPDSTELCPTLYLFKRHLSDTCFQYGRLQTGSSHNFAYNPDINPISKAKLGFPWTYISIY